MSDKTETSRTTKAHSLNFCKDILTVNGVVKVLEISDREAQLKLPDSTLTVRGTGLNVIKLEREEGIIQLETKTLQSIAYRHGGVGLKGLFR